MHNLTTYVEMSTNILNVLLDMKNLFLDEIIANSTETTNVYFATINSTKGPDCNTNPTKNDIHDNVTVSYIFLSWGLLSFDY